MTRCVLLEALTWISRGQELRAETVPASVIAPLEPPSESNGTLSGSVKDFVRQNFDARLDLESIARAVCTNKSHLCCQFKAETGMTVVEYLTKVRIDASKRLLMTSLKAAEICTLVGFDDPYYFSRVFKKLVGTPPSEFRSRCTGFS
jgi:YesN/AraC family two-component response regulator